VVKINFWHFWPSCKNIFGYPWKTHYWPFPGKNPSDANGFHAHVCLTDEAIRTFATY